MQYQNFDVEIAEGCARVTMIGPGAPDMANLCDEFVDLLLRLQEDGAVRLVLLTDGDHTFEYQQSLDALSERPGSDEGLGILAADEEIGRKVVTLMQEFPKPIVAATRGDIRGLGLGFFLAADIRLATAGASFTAPNASGGLLPGWGLSHTLPRLMGPGRALEFLWGGRTLGGEEAFRLGLVDRLLGEAGWEEELDRLCANLRQVPQPAVRLTKLGSQQAGDLDLTTMLSFEWECQQQCWASRETAEGLQAWQEDRAPRLDSQPSDQED